MATCVTGGASVKPAARARAAERFDLLDYAPVAGSDELFWQLQRPFAQSYQNVFTRNFLDGTCPRGISRLKMDEPKAMDAIDKRILRIVQKDASLPICVSPCRSDFRKPHVGKRSQRLDASGVIKRRIALLDPLKVGLGLTAFVSVQVGDHSGKAIARFAAEIAAMEEVMRGALLPGGRRRLRLACRCARCRGLRYFLQASDRNNSAQERYVAFRVGKRQIRNCLSNCLPELTARGPEHWFPDPCRAAPPDFHRGRPAPARKFAKSPRRALNGQVRSRHCGNRLTSLPIVLLPSNVRNGRSDLIAVRGVSVLIPPRSPHRRRSAVYSSFPDLP